MRLPALIAVLTVISILLWCHLFRFLLNASAPLQGDAFPYLGHIRFYVENMMRGVYPLWNPYENVVNEFFLRRIGEFNPFFGVIALLKTAGLPFQIAHRIFLAGYFFLGMGGFYLFCRRLFGDQRVSFMATLTLFFSALGAQTFESFLLLEIVPYIWFFFFLTAFVQTPRRIFMLGAVFALMIINITYIPFYFYVLFSLFLLIFAMLYAPGLGQLAARARDFAKHNRMFTLACAGLLAVSLIPGMLWYQQARRGEALPVDRHVGSTSPNSATVGLNKVNEGGARLYLILDRQFVNLDKLELKDFYIPLFAFLMLAAGAWLRLNRRLVCLFGFGCVVFLIGLADASYVHEFLYKYTPFFKYFRNMQFFLWLGVLPVFILFVAEELRVFLKSTESKNPNRGALSAWVIVVHGAASGFFLYSGISGFATYAVIVLSLIWMLAHIWGLGRPQITLIILWGAVVLQPFEAFSRFALAYPPLPRPEFAYEFNYAFELPTAEAIQRATNGEVRSKSYDPPYFTTQWFYKASSHVNNVVLGKYGDMPFIAYDRVESVSGEVDWQRLEGALTYFENVAFVSSPNVPTGTGTAPPAARVMSNTDQDFKVLKFDANEMKVKMSFAEPKFLVSSVNYHSQWRAFIDGKPAPLWRTNVFAQGLWVPAGDHVVHWRFAPGWRFALAYGLAALYFGILGWLLWSWSRTLKK